MTAAVFMLTLCACAASETGMERFESMRQSVVDRELSFSADITADQGRTVENFSVDCLRADREYLITITSPELIRGISARTDNGGTGIEFDGVILDIGNLNSDGLTPVSAVPTIITAMEKGHLENFWKESSDSGEVYAALLNVSGDVDVILYMDAETMSPIGAEIRNDLITVLRCSFSGWNLA